jgi:hypothetical protein
MSNVLPLLKESNVIELIEPAPERLAISREAWAKTPPETRSEILRMVTELERGIERYRPASERDASMQEWHEMAAKSGTTLKAALEKYVGVEQRLREKPVAEICRIIANAGEDPVEFFQRYLDEHPAEAEAEAEAVLEREAAL